MATERSMTFFDTDPKWLSEIRIWASMLEDVREIWLFGSRATGQRRSKEGAGEPNLDLAIVPVGADVSERLCVWIDESKRWTEQVQHLVPVKVDLQLCDFDTDDQVPGWVRASGVRIYSRDGSAA